MDPLTCIAALLLVAFVACTREQTEPDAMLAIGVSIGSPVNVGVRATVGADPDAAPATPPAWGAAGTFLAGTTDQTPAWPAHSSGHMGYIVVESPLGVATPAGYTKVPGTEAQGTSTVLDVFEKRAASGAESAPTVAVGSNNHIWCGIVTVTGATGSGSAVDAGDGSASGASGLSTVTFPTVTTTGGSRLVLLITSWSIDDAGPLASGFTNGGLTLITERVDGGTAVGNGGGIAIATGVLTPTGSTGTSTCALAQASLWSCMTIAVKP